MICLGLNNPAFLVASKMHCDYSTMINMLRLKAHECPETHSDIFNLRGKMNAVPGHDSH